MKLAGSLVVMLLLLFPAVSFAQTRSRRSSAQRRRPAAASTAKTSPLELVDGRNRVAQQIKDLTRFIYLYGRITKDLEASEAQARGSGASPQAAALSNQARERLRNSVGGVRDQLDGLELHFRTTPALERFYVRLVGVAAGAAGAEEQVAANQLDQAGRLLVDVVGRLTDVLTQMSEVGG